MLPGSVVWSDIKFWKFSVIIISNIFSFLSLFSFWYSLYADVTRFIVVPRSLDLLFLSVFVLFAFKFLNLCSAERRNL